MLPPETIKIKILALQICLTITDKEKGREEREREEGKSFTGRMFFGSRPLFGAST